MEKNKIMMIIIIALLVFLLVAIGVVTFTVFRFLSVNKEAGDVQAKATAVKLTAKEIDLVPLSSPINANLLTGSDNVEHVIRVSITIGINNTEKKESPEIKALVEASQSIVNDLVLGVLKNKTYQELNRPNGRDVLKDEILQQLQIEFDSNLIVAVYFDELFLQ